MAKTPKPPVNDSNELGVSISIADLAGTKSSAEAWARIAGTTFGIDHLGNLHAGNRFLSIRKGQEELKKIGVDPSLISSQQHAKSLYKQVASAKNASMVLPAHSLRTGAGKAVDNSIRNDIPFKTNTVISPQSSSKAAVAPSATTVFSAKYMTGDELHQKSFKVHRVGYNEGQGNTPLGSAFGNVRHVSFGGNREGDHLLAEVNRSGGSVKSGGQLFVPSNRRASISPNPFGGDDTPTYSSRFYQGGVNNQYPNPMRFQHPDSIIIPYAPMERYSIKSDSQYRGLGIDVRKQAMQQKIMSDPLGGDRRKINSGRGAFGYFDSELWKTGGYDVSSFKTNQEKIDYITKKDRQKARSGMGLLEKMEDTGGIQGRLASNVNSMLAAIKEIGTKPPLPGSTLGMLASASKGADGFKVGPGGSLYKSSSQTTSSGAAIYTPVHNVAGNNTGAGYNKPSAKDVISGRFNPLSSGGGFTYSEHIGGKKRAGGGSGKSGEDPGSDPRGGFLKQSFGQFRHAAIWSAYAPILGMAGYAASAAVGQRDFVSKPTFSLVGAGFDSSMRDRAKAWALGTASAFERPQDRLSLLKEVASAYGEKPSKHNQHILHELATNVQAASEYTMGDPKDLAKYAGRMSTMFQKTDRTMKALSKKEAYNQTLDLLSGMSETDTAKLAELSGAAKYAMAPMLTAGFTAAETTGLVSYFIEQGLGQSQVGVGFRKLGSGTPVADKMAKTELIMEQLERDFAKKGYNRGAIKEALKMATKRGYWLKPENAAILSRRKSQKVKEIHSSPRGLAVASMNYGRNLRYMGEELGIPVQQLVDQESLPLMYSFSEMESPEDLLNQVEKAKQSQADPSRRRAVIRGRETDTSPKGVWSRIGNIHEMQMQQFAQNMVPLGLGIEKAINDPLRASALVDKTINKDRQGVIDSIAESQDAARRGVGTAITPGMVRGAATVAKYGENTSSDYISPYSDHQQLEWEGSKTSLWDLGKGIYTSFRNMGIDIENRVNKDIPSYVPQERIKNPLFDQEEFSEGSKKEIAQAKDRIESGALESKMVINVYVDGVQRETKADIEQQGSPTNSKVGMDHGSRTTPFAWGNPK